MNLQEMHKELSIVSSISIAIGDDPNTFQKECVYWSIGKDIDMEYDSSAKSISLLHDPFENPIDRALYFTLCGIASHHELTFNCP